LTLEQAYALNAPLENVDPSIPRTPELIKAIEFRRNAISIEEMEEAFAIDNHDPLDEFIDTYGNTKIKMENNTKHNMKHDIGGNKE
jgi:hypothetical protein